MEALNLRKIGISKLKNTFENSSENMNWIYYYFIFDNLGLDKSLYTSFGINSSGIDSSSSSGSSSGSSGGGGAGGF